MFYFSGQHPLAYTRSFGFCSKQKFWHDTYVKGYYINVRAFAENIHQLNTYAIITKGCNRFH